MEEYLNEQLQLFYNTLRTDKDPESVFDLNTDQIKKLLSNILFFAFMQKEKAKYYKQWKENLLHSSKN